MEVEQEPQRHVQQFVVGLVLEQKQTKLRRFDHRRNAQVRSIAFRRDAWSFVTGCGDGFARIWDVRTKRELQRRKHGG